MNVIYIRRNNLRVQKVDFDVVVNDIKTRKYADKIQELRYFADAPEVVSEKALGSITEAGVPTMFPAVDGKKYTGVVTVSLLSNGHYESLLVAKENLKILSQVRCCFVGASRRTLKVMMAYSLPDGTLPEKDTDIKLFHALAYRNSSALLMQITGLKADGEHGDWRNGLPLSDDEDIYYNENSFVVPLQQPTALPAQLVAQSIDDKSLCSSRLLPNYDELQMEVTRFNLVCRKLNFEKDRKADDYIIALAQECRHAGIDCEVAIKCVLRFHDMRAHELMVRTAFEVAYSEGPLGTNDVISKPLRMQLLLRDYMDRRYVFRRNVITGSVEFVERDRYITSWHPVNDSCISTMCLDAQMAGIEAWDKDVRRYISSDKISEWDPIRSWLYDLPVWDGKDRVGELAATVKTTYEDWGHDFAVWMRSMVNQWLGGSSLYGSTMVMLLIGGQGTGKSSFCKRLVPEALMPYYNDRIDFSSKREAERALIRFGLICMDEFDQISRSQTAFMKHILQKSDVKWRKLYQDDIEQRQRYAAFCATTNSYSPLSDPTGSRRFLCTEILEPIDLFGEIDHEQLYAQVVHEIKAGEQCFFTAEDERRIQKQNERYQQEVPLQTMLMSMFRLPKDGDDEVQELTTVDVLRELKKVYSSLKCDVVTSQKLGKIMTASNFPKRRVNRGWAYSCVKIA